MTARLGVPVSSLYDLERFVEMAAKAIEESVLHRNRQKSFDLLSAVIVLPIHLRCFKLADLNAIGHDPASIE